MTFKKLADYFSALEATASHLKITEILAELFKETSIEEIDEICYLSLGRLAPLYAGIEFNLAEKLMIRVLAQAFEQPEEKIRQEFKKIGDLGDMVYQLKIITAIAGSRFCGTIKNSKLSVNKVYERLYEIAQEAGKGSVERKISRMVVLLADLDAQSAKFVVRIPLGRLRLGFSELTILDALSWMLVGDKSKREEIEALYNVRADIGQIAKIIKFKGLKGLKSLKIQLGVPVMPSLCQRLPNAEEMIKKMCRPEVEHPRSKRSRGKVAVEPKFDGTRLAVHFCQPGFVRIFTRNLENVTHMFPDIADALPREVKAKQVILDGEAIGFDPKTGKFLPFQETIKRKRKYEIGKTAKEIPLKYFAFDILYKDGKDLLALPFNKRREILKETLNSRNKTILLSPQIVTDKAEALRQFHHEQIRKGFEGVVAKKWEAPYDPGRRGFTWVKLKSEKGKKGGGLADTLDCVVMGYYQGKGKRAGFGIGAFLVGIRESENSDRFLTISKIGTGLTDEQWRGLKLKIKNEKLKIKKKPKQYKVDKDLIPDVWCTPKIVVEIEADNITVSPIHTAGLALRFPRLVRFRDDKIADQATTLAEAKKLYKLQG